MTFYNYTDTWTDGTNVGTPQTDAETVTWTLAGGGVEVEVTATLDGNGNVVFDFGTDATNIDLTGFYLDINNDGGKYAAANWLDWMTGSDSDGDRLDGWDFAATIGTLWSCDTSTTSGTLSVSMAQLGITSLSDLDGAEVGFNSVVKSGWCSSLLRLADTGTAHYADNGGVDGTPVAGYIEMADSQIDSVILNFYVNGEPAPHAGDQNGDWYYSVKVDVPEWASEDPDAYLDQLVAKLIETDPNLDANSGLKSVIVIEADGDMTNYGTSIGTSDNGELPDGLPWNVFNDFDHMLDDNTDIAGGIEAYYDLSGSTDMFLFA